jgi:dipeptidyl aminopeptidase/acylaminoacyl peptidase
MEQALHKSGVPVKLVVVPGQKHTFFNLPVDKRQALPDFFAETVNWLDTYLRHGPGAPTQ